MTSLKNEDLRAMLGDNWRAVSDPNANDGLTDIERALEKQKKSAVDQNFSAIAVLVIGMVLAVAGLYRAGASPYESYVGFAVVLVGLSWLSYLRVQKTKRS
jgi:hypothetical protein